MKLMALFIAGMLVLSCNTNEKNNEAATKKEEEAKKQSSAMNCYRYANATDTVSLKLIHVAETITGTLIYNLKEKDKNQGTIQGAMKGNLLVADYTFQSEGMRSVRQVVFKLEGNSFIEGYGDIDMQNDKARFKNIDSLQFNSAIKLTGTDCQLGPAL
jgi:hypothetical protein